MIIDTDKLLDDIGYDFMNRLTSCDECDVNIMRVASILKQIESIEAGQRLLVNALIELAKKYQKEDENATRSDSRQV